MPQLYLFLQLTDGVTTVTLADGLGGPTSAFLERGAWTPRVAAKRWTYLGGESEYADIDEDIPIVVRAATAAASNALVGTLRTLIEQAEDWARGKKGALPVLIKYVPVGSETASLSDPYTTIILGRRPGDDAPLLELPLDSDSTRVQRLLRGVRLRFLRRGAWHLAEQASNLATNVRSYDVPTLTWSQGALVGNHPVRLDIGALTATAGQTSWHQGYVVLAPSTDTLQRYEAETVIGTGTVSSPTTTYPAGGGVRIITATAIASLGSFTPALAACGQFNLFASLYISSGTWEARAGISTAAGGISTAYQPLARNPNDDVTIVAFPPLGTPGTVTGAWVDFARVSATGQLDIDYIVVAGDARILTLLPLTYPSGVSPATLRIDPAPLAARKPQVAVLTGTGGSQVTTAVSYEEDAYLTMTGSTLAVGFFVVPNTTGAATWALTASGEGTGAQQQQIAAYRRPSVVLPV